MAEADTFTFSHRELAEILVRSQGLHEGIWGIHIEFSFGAANIMQPGSVDVIPAAIVPVKAVGIHRYEQANNFTVDASEVNPSPQSAKRIRAKKT